MLLICPTHCQHQHQQQHHQQRPQGRNQRHHSDGEIDERLSVQNPSSWGRGSESGDKVGGANCGQPSKPPRASSESDCFKHFNSWHNLGERPRVLKEVLLSHSKRLTPLSMDFFTSATDQDTTDEFLPLSSIVLQGRNDDNLIELCVVASTTFDIQMSQNPLFYEGYKVRNQAACLARIRNRHRETFRAALSILEKVAKEAFQRRSAIRIQATYRGYACRHLPKGAQCPALTSISTRRRCYTRQCSELTMSDCNDDSFTSLGSFACLSTKRTNGASFDVCYEGASDDEHSADCRPNSEGTSESECHLRNEDDGQAFDSISRQHSSDSQILVGRHSKRVIKTEAGHSSYSSYFHSPCPGDTPVQPPRRKLSPPREPLPCNEDSYHQRAVCLPDLTLFDVNDDDDDEDDDDDDDDDPSLRSLSLKPKTASFSNRTTSSFANIFETNFDYGSPRRPQRKLSPETNTEAHNTIRSLPWLSPTSIINDNSCSTHTNDLSHHNYLSHVYRWEKITV